jgi:hypothetical protein
MTPGFETRSPPNLLVATLATFTFYLAGPMSSIGPGLVIPDLWQQEAVRALQQKKDVGLACNYNPAAKVSEKNKSLRRGRQPI